MGDRWLVIAEEVFLPADSGGRVETLHFLQALLADGLRLTVLIPGEDQRSTSGYAEALPGAEVLFVPRRSGWRTHLSLMPYVFASRPMPLGLPSALRREHRRRPFSAVVSSSFRVAHLGITLAEVLHLPLLVRPHNVESQYFFRLARGARGVPAVAYLLEAAKLRWAERQVHASSVVRAFADLSYDDERTRARRTRRPTLTVPPFLPAAAETNALGPIADDNGQEQGDAGELVVFVGSLDVANNVEAVRWFARACWPIVSDRRPSARLRVVGRRPGTSTRSLLGALPTATLVADVPDVAPHLRAAAVVVNPVQQGSGINIKVVDAMAAGAAVVCTSAGARGLPWVPGRDLLVADEPAAFAAAVVSLLGDRGYRERLGRSGRRFVEAELDARRSVARLRALVSPVQTSQEPDGRSNSTVNKNQAEGGGRKIRSY